MFHEDETPDDELIRTAHETIERTLREATDEMLLETLEELEFSLDAESFDGSALIAHCWTMDEVIRRYSDEVVKMNHSDWSNFGGIDLSKIEYMTDKELNMLPSVYESVKKVLRSRID